MFRSLGIVGPERPYWNAHMQIENHSTLEDDIGNPVTGKDVSFISG